MALPSRDTIVKVRHQTLIAVDKLLSLRSLGVGQLLAHNLVSGSHAVGDAIGTEPCHRSRDRQHCDLRGRAHYIKVLPEH